MEHVRVLSQDRILELHTRVVACLPLTVEAHDEITTCVHRRQANHHRAEHSRLLLRILAACQPMPALDGRSLCRT